jgi:hypothetical protein
MRRAKQRRGAVSEPLSGGRRNIEHRHCSLREILGSAGPCFQARLLASNGNIEATGSDSPVKIGLCAHVTFDVVRICA